MIALKCIIKSNWWIPIGLTANKIYYIDTPQVVDEKSSSYYLKGDDGEYNFFKKENFIEIKEWRDQQLNKLL